MKGLCNLHKDVDNSIMKYFEFEHLPPHLQTISSPIAKLARDMNGRLPDSPEKSAGLRKLLEAKDCFVRANLEQPKKTEIYSQPDCLFAYCPHPEECQAGDGTCINSQTKKECDHVWIYEGHGHCDSYYKCNKCSATREE